MSGTWSPLTNQPPFSTDTMLLLTDGTVICHENDAPYWWRLIPDVAGDYSKGTWLRTAPMQNYTIPQGTIVIDDLNNNNQVNLGNITVPYAPTYYASAILADGRLFVAGGEYQYIPDRPDIPKLVRRTVNIDVLAAQIYDPVADTWTSLPTPTGWTAIGDAPCCLLPDGRLLLGSIFNQSTAIYDPGTNTWVAAANKDDACSEETWTLLPDNTILNVECNNHPRCERYIIAMNEWVSAGSTPHDLVESSSIEIGPAILLPDGRTFAIGATGNTALYTMPTVVTQQGSWVDGPTFPPQAPNQKVGAKDAPACLLPNGKVLCTAGPVDNISNDYLSPTYFFEFDPHTSTLNVITAPSNSDLQPYTGRMILLPTGQVLYANSTQDIEVYTPDGQPQAAWRPQITNCPTTLQPNQTYTLQGLQLNGLSQAVSYGDDASMATNYPLVRLIGEFSGKVYYCRTHHRSSCGVATGNTVLSTQFTLPSTITAGPFILTVVTNGIASSNSVAVTVTGATNSRHSVHNLLASVDGRLELFVVGNDGALWHIWQTALNSGWSNWYSHGNAGVGLSGSPALARNADGRIEIFAVCKDGSMRHIWQTAPSGNWSPWASQGSAGSGLTGSPSLEASADGRLELFAVGKDGNLWHIWQTALNNGWSNWYAHGNAGVGLSGSPAMAANADGRLELFVVCKDGTLRHIWQTAPSGNWSPWASQGSAGGGLSGSPILAPGADGRLELFVVGKDGNLWHIWQTALNNGWSNWYSHGNAGVGLSGPLVLEANADGRLELYARASDGSIRHIWQTAPSGNWSPWTSPGSAGGGLSGPLALGANADGRLELYTRGNDGAMWHIWQTAPNNGWVNWFSQGSAGGGFVSVS